MPNNANETKQRIHTRDILIPSQRSGHSGLVGKNNLVVLVRGEQPLKEGDGRVEDDSAFTSTLDADVDLLVVDQVRAYRIDERRGVIAEVGGAEEGSKLERFNLFMWGSSSLAK